MKNKAYTQKAAALLCKTKSTQPRALHLRTDCCASHDGNHRLPCCCTGILQTMKR